jgi:hypothetical protein
MVNRSQNRTTVLTADKFASGRRQTFSVGIVIWVVLRVFVKDDACIGGTNLECLLSFGL